MSKHHVTTTVNGDAVEFLCDTRQTLLDVLRDELGMTGTKEGCATGDCGACSVTLDGRLVCSCLMLGVEARGKAIQTIEGMAQGDHLHVLQRKFLEHAALQCGICTPGFLISARSLLERNPDPSEEEVRYGLAGNLCRCTGYQKIVQPIDSRSLMMKIARKGASRCKAHTLSRPAPVRRIASSDGRVGPAWSVQRPIGTDMNIGITASRESRESRTPTVNAEACNCNA